MCYINTLIIKTQTLVSLGDLEVALPNVDITWASAFSYPKWPILVAEINQLKVVHSEWGFIPSGIKSHEEVNSFRKQFMTQNATCENLTTSRTFKPSLLQQRCIIPSSGFIEWQHKAISGKKTADKIPYFIQPANDTFFYMAGLYSIAPLPSGMLHSFTIVTTEANSTMANIHNTKKRMPTILSATDAATWLLTENISVVQDLAHLQAPDATLKPHIIAKNFKEISNPLAPFYDSKPTQLDLFG